MVENNDLRIPYIFRRPEMLPGAAHKMNHPVYS